MDDGSNKMFPGWVAPVVSVVGLAVLSFYAGAATTYFQVFPYPQLLEEPFLVIEAQMERARFIDQDVSPSLSRNWVPPRTEIRGVDEYREGEAYEGYTTYTSMHEPGGYLIDMDGEVVHKWSLAFSEAWESPPHIDRPVGDQHTHWRGMHVYPNGDVLAHYFGEGDTPYGYGLVKVNAASEIIWKFSDTVHHDITVNDDGTIWTLTQEFRDYSDRPDLSLPRRFKNTLILDDDVVLLSPDGEVVHRSSLTEAVARYAEPEELASWHSGPAWDLLHTNNVEPVSEQFARHHDFVEPGQLMVSFRSLDAIGLYDPEAEEMVWMMRGFWSQQHDPDPLENGNILIFDNLGYSGAGGRSRIAEFSPKTGEIVWQYTGSEAHPFFTRRRGKQTPLPNGNVLVNENLAGRMFEVNRQGEIVWEFYNPVRTVEDDQVYIPILGDGVQRLRPSELTFVD